MPTLYYVQNSAVGIILVSIILFYVLGQGGRRQAQDSLFVALLLATLSIIITELAIDLLSGKVFYGSRTLLTLVTVVFYLLNPVPGTLYLLYLDQLRRRWVRIPRGMGSLAFTPLVVALILISTSLFNGCIFSIDSNNIYMRGPYFSLIIVTNLSCMFIGFLYLIFYRDSFKRKDFSLFLFFPVPVLVGSLLQGMFYGVEIAGTSLALTLLIVYLHMQNTQANKDYLTKLYNRSISEQYLQNLISHQKKSRSIGGILMDINDFKQINDTYGHDLGDKALRHLSQLLRDSFGASWLIARFGGDEFILFRERATQQELEASKEYFVGQLALFNVKETLPFPISVSIGAIVLKAYEAIDSSTFFKVLDDLMYEAKRAYHENQ